MRQVAVFALLAVAACSGKDQQPSRPSAADALADAAKTKSLPVEHYVSPTEKFDVSLPGAWTGHYSVTEKRDTTSGARLAVEFKFKPDSGSKAPPLTALVMRIFPKKSWDAFVAKYSREPAAKIGEHGTDVYGIVMPGTNPYPANSPEAPVFDRMLISISQGGQQVHVAFQP